MEKLFDLFFIKSSFKILYVSSVIRISVPHSLFELSVREAKFTASPIGIFHLVFGTHDSAGGSSRIYTAAYSDVGLVQCAFLPAWAAVKASASLLYFISA